MRGISQRKGRKKCIGVVEGPLISAACRHFQGFGGVEVDRDAAKSHAVCCTVTRAMPKVHVKYNIGRVEVGG